MKEYKQLKKLLLSQKLRLIISSFKLEKQTIKKKWLNFNEFKKLLQVKPHSPLNRLFISKVTKKIKKGEKNGNAKRKEKGISLDQSSNQKDEYDYINFEFILFPNQKIKEIYFAQKKSILDKFKQLLASLKRKNFIFENKYRTLKSLKIFNEMTCNELNFFDALRTNAEEIRKLIEKQLIPYN